MDPRHLLRLGSGEVELRDILASAGAGGTGRGRGEEFSKQGRVDWSLARRIQLLGQVQYLGTTLGVPGDVGYTCETAQYFYLQIKTLIDDFERNISNTNRPIQEIFPFSGYFANTPEPLFSGDRLKDTESARGCMRHLQKMFDELQDYR